MAGALWFVLFCARLVEESPDGIGARSLVVPVHGALHHYLLARGGAGYHYGGSSGGDLVGHTVSLAGIVSSAKLHETTS